MAGKDRLLNPVPKDQPTGGQGAAASPEQEAIDALALFGYSGVMPMGNGVYRGYHAASNTFGYFTVDPATGLFVEIEDPLATPSGGSGSRMSPSLITGRDGTVFRYDPNTDTFSSLGQFPGLAELPNYTIEQDPKTGRLIAINPQDPTDRKDLGQFGFAGIDPRETELRRQVEADRNYNLALNQESRLAKQSAAEAAIGLQNAELAKSQAIAEILRNPSDFVARAFMQRGQDSPLPKVTQGDLISQLQNEFARIEELYKSMQTPDAPHGGNLQSPDWAALGVPPTTDQQSTTPGPAASAKPPVSPTRLGDTPPNGSAAAPSPSRLGAAVGEAPQEPDRPPLIGSGSIDEAFGAPRGPLDAGTSNPFVPSYLTPDQIAAASNKGVFNPGAVRPERGDKTGVAYDPLKRLIANIADSGPYDIIRAISPNPAIQADRLRGWLGFAQGGVADDPAFIVGEEKPGDIGDTGELVLNLGDGRFIVISNKQLKALGSGVENFTMGGFEQAGKSNKKDRVKSKANRGGRPLHDIPGYDGGTRPRLSDWQGNVSVTPATSGPPGEGEDASGTDLSRRDFSRLVAAWLMKDYQNGGQEEQIRLASGGLGAMAAATAGNRYLTTRGMEPVDWDVLSAALGWGSSGVRAGKGLWDAIKDRDIPGFIAGSFDPNMFHQTPGRQTGSLAGGGYYYRDPATGESGTYGNPTPQGTFNYLTGIAGHTPQQAQAATGYTPDFLLPQAPGDPGQQTIDYLAQELKTRPPAVNSILTGTEMPKLRIGGPGYENEPNIASRLALSELTRDELAALNVSLALRYNTTLDDYIKRSDNLFLSGANARPKLRLSR